MTQDKPSTQIARINKINEKLILKVRLGYKTLDAVHGRMTINFILIEQLSNHITAYGDVWDNFDEDLIKLSRERNETI